MGVTWGRRVGHLSLAVAVGHWARGRARTTRRGPGPASYGASGASALCGGVARLPSALGCACLLAHLAHQLRLLVGCAPAVEVAVRTVVLPFGAGLLLALAAALAHGVVDVLAVGHGFSRR